MAGLDRVTRGMGRAAASTVSMLVALVVLPLMLLAVLIARIASYSGNPAVKRLGQRLGEFDFGPPAIPPHMEDDSPPADGWVIEGEVKTKDGEKDNNA